MFGFLYSVFCLGVKGFSKLYLDIENESLKCNSTDGITYFDHYGQLRLLSNNHTAIIITKPNGDTVLKDCINREEVKNYTKERMDEINAEKYKDPDTVAIRIDSNHHKSDPIKGFRYKDLETGQIYVKRFLTEEGINGFFFMDLNGYLVKPIKKSAFTEKRFAQIKKYNDHLDWQKETFGFYTKLNNPISICDHFDESNVEF